MQTKKLLLTCCFLVVHNALNFNIKVNTADITRICISLGAEVQYLR